MNKKIMQIEKMIRREYNDGNATYHANAERKRRITLANNLINKEQAILLDSFKVDCGHKNGAEIHNVYNNGVIKIYNLETKRFITTLIGHPNQVKRYYEACGIIKTLPINVIDKCREHRCYINS